MKLTPAGWFWIPYLALVLSGTAWALFL